MEKRKITISGVGNAWTAGQPVVGDRRRDRLRTRTRPRNTASAMEVCGSFQRSSEMVRACRRGSNRGIGSRDAPRHQDTIPYAGCHHLAGCPGDRPPLSLSPSDAVIREVKRLYRPALSSRPVTSMHIPRGDYLNHMDTYRIPGIGYYRRALNKLEAEQIVVFSDDPQWAPDNLRFRSTTLVPNLSNFLDLAAMTLCSRHVIAISSFFLVGRVLVRVGPGRLPVGVVHTRQRASRRAFE
jgi:hypothetical protein